MPTISNSVDRLRKLKTPLSAARLQPRVERVPAPLQAGKASVDQLKVLDDVANLSPSLASILRPQAAYRWLLPYLAAITPQYVEGVLRGALAGNHVQAWELFDLMIDTDPEIAACVQEYNEGILKKKFVFTPYREEDQEPTDSAVEKCRVVSAALRNMRPDMANDENDLRSTVRDIVAARFHGQSLLEMEWHEAHDSDRLNVRNVPGLGQVLCPRSTMWVHPVCYAWGNDGRLGLRVALTDTKRQTKDARSAKLGKLKGPTGEAEQPLWNTVISQPRPSMIQDFPRDKFLIAIHKSKTGTALGGSCLRPLAWWWVASNFCGDWLLNYAQLFGIPFRKATYKPGTPLSTQVEIKQMLQAMGSAGYVLLPDNADLEFESPTSGAGESPQAFLFNFANDQKRKVILHQTMSGGSHSGGSKGTGKAFGAVEQDTKAACVDEGADFAESVINLQLVPMILELNYGEGGDIEAPTVSLVDDETGNYQDAQAIQMLSTVIDVGENHVRKLFNLPKPSAGEKLLGQDTGSTAAAARQQMEMQQAQMQAQADAYAQQYDQGDETLAAARAIEASKAAQALAGTMKPMLARLEAISKITDPLARIEAMRKFLKDEPTITAALKRDPSLAKAVGAEGVKALMDGLKEKD